MSRQCPLISGLACLAGVRAVAEACDDCEGALEHRLRSEWSGRGGGVVPRDTSRETRERESDEATA
jgi:hypothetical protein